MKIISAATPKWSDDSLTKIDLTIDVEGIGLIPFTASADDVELHGRELFAKAIAGDFGPIAPKPPQLLPDVKAAKLDALAADRKRIETLPITGNNGGTVFKISRPEKIQEFLMGGLSIALDPSPNATFTMLDDDGVSVEYGKVLMGQIIKFINTSKAPALARYAARKAAVEAATTTAEVDAVNVNLMEA